MAYIVLPCMVMACIVMASLVMACILMAYIIVACIVIAYTVMANTVMTLCILSNVHTVKYIVDHIDIRSVKLSDLSDIDIHTVNRISVAYCLSALFSTFTLSRPPYVLTGL